MRESIFAASLRALFVTLFGVIGIVLGLLLIIAIIGAISGTSEGQPELNYTYTPEIVPNGEGVRKELSSDAPVILKVNIHGTIGMDTLTRQNIERQLTESRERSFKNDRVKALLLHIDSPGGTVSDAAGIYSAIQAYKTKYKVPVYAFADGLCASGGLYVAAAADKIYASDATIVGSVGVILPAIFNISTLMDKLGVQSMTIFDGKGKDNLSALRPWKPGEDQNIRDAIAYYYSLFVDVIVSNRPKMDRTKLVDEFGANIFPAGIAKEHGYIDESNASLSQVIKDLAKAIGIEDDYYQVVQFQNKSWTSLLFGTSLQGLFTGKVTHELLLLPETETKLMGQYLYLHQP